MKLLDHVCSSADLTLVLTVSAAMLDGHESLTVKASFPTSCDQEMGTPCPFL